MCPFIPGAIKHDSLYVKVVRFDAGDAEKSGQSEEEFYLNCLEQESANM